MLSSAVKINLSFGKANKLLTTVNVGVKKQNELITCAGIEPSEMHFMWSPIYCLEIQREKNTVQYILVVLSIEGNVGSYFYCWEKV